MDPIYSVRRVDHLVAGIYVLFSRAVSHSQVYGTRYFFFCNTALPTLLDTFLARAKHRVSE